jgi:excinuclease UvrABC ATPase subunit
MLRRSNRKRSVPAGKRDAITASAKRTLRNPHSTVGSSTSTAISGSAEIIYSRIGMPASFVRSISLPTVTPSVHVSTIVTRNQANQQMSTVTSPSLGKQLAPVNLKQKIIAGEYIDLVLLLINSQAFLSDKHTVIVSHGELLIEPKQQHKQIVNIETWTDAFFYLYKDLLYHTSSQISRPS